MHSIFMLLFREGLEKETQTGSSMKTTIPNSIQKCFMFFFSQFCFPFVHFQKHFRGFTFLLLNFDYKLSEFESKRHSQQFHCQSHAHHQKTISLIYKAFSMNLHQFSVDVDFLFYKHYQLPNTHKKGFVTKTTKGYLKMKLQR